MRQQLYVYTDQHWSLGDNPACRELKFWCLTFDPTNWVQKKKLRNAEQFAELAQIAVWSAEQFAELTQVET